VEITSGHCSLIIYGRPNLDIERINDNLCIIPTRVRRKGEIAHKIAGPIKADVWIYEIKISQEPNITLNELLKLLIPHKDFIVELFKSADICIRCYIQSALAQIGFDFSPDTIKMLAELNIKFEISIISWGEVEMENELDQE
jgi:hypothetical protein